MVIVMISCSSLLALLITVFEVNASYRHGVATIKQLHTDLQLVHRDVLVEQVWGLNDRAAQASIEGLVRLNNIDRVELRWEDYYELTAGEPIDAAEIESIFPIYKARSGQQYQLGELHLYSSLTALRREITSELGLKLLFNLLKTLVVSGVVLYFFHRLATVHLHTIAKHADSLVLGQSYKSLSLNRSSNLADDELQTLVNAINGMGCRLQRDFLNTKQKKAELQHLVSERTKHLAEANEKLIEKSRLATIGSLVAMVAHELRNPMGSIKASVNLLHMRSTNRDDIAIIGRIDRNIARCDETVEQLRRMGKKSVQHWDVIELGPWLEEYVRSKVKLQHGIELHCDLDDDIWVFVDQFQLDMVIRNLFENAQQALGTSEELHERKIFMRLKKREEGACVCLRDTGIGLNEVSLKRAFDPLYTTKQYGFGMGLSLSRNLIESLGGELSLSSEGPLQGALVQMCLPLARQVKQPEALI